MDLRMFHPTQTPVAPWTLPTVYEMRSDSTYDMAIARPRGTTWESNKLKVSISRWDPGNIQCDGRHIHVILDLEM